MSALPNLDQQTVDSFGDEWSRFDQSELAETDHQRFFNAYFHVFPWDSLPENAQGFDMGCGSGRWSKLVAPRVGRLHCIDPAKSALEVAQRNLAGFANITFHHASTETAPLPESSQDFGYSLGVLHHIPDTQEAMRQCVTLLKPGAPFLVYLYYRFDNRPFWFQWIWRTSELLRRSICNLPNRYKHLATDVIAALVYYPLARINKIGDKLGLPMKHVPLYAYRNAGFYVMKTDSRDRFGTPLEQRFTKTEIQQMMENCGLERVEFSPNEPFWCAVGYKRA